MAQLDFVIALIVIVAVETGNQRHSSAGNGGLEALRLRNDEVGRNASVRPAANTEPVRIGNALRNRIIHHGHVILIILVAPIRVNRSTELLPIAGRPARIRKQNRVATRRVKLRGSASEFARSEEHTTELQ